MGSKLQVKTGCFFKQGTQLVGIDACELLHLGASEFLRGELKEFHTVEVRTFAIGNSALVHLAIALKVKKNGLVRANNGFGTQHHAEGADAANLVNDGFSASGDGHVPWGGRVTDLHSIAGLGRVRNPPPWSQRFR